MRLIIGTDSSISSLIPPNISPLKKQRPKEAARSMPFFAPSFMVEMEPIKQPIQSPIRVLRRLTKAITQNGTPNWICRTNTRYAAPMLVKILCRSNVAIREDKMSFILLMGLTSTLAPNEERFA